MSHKLFWVLSILLGWTIHSFSQLSLVERASGFINPVDIASAGDGSGRLFIVEQAGIVKVVSSTYADLGTYLNITSKVADFDNELGLLGLTFDPDYENNGYFYVYYSNNAGSLKTILERYQVSNPAANSASIIDIDTIVLIPQFDTNHNGGDLNFGPDGYLYCGVGDGGGSNGPGDSAQIMSTLLGKLIRINPANLQVEIWAAGLRNPWRFSFDSETGDLWIADVGQSAREEVNFVTSQDNVQGLNYGWNCWEGTISCGACGNNSCGTVVFPVLEYTHLTGRSITGGY
ncbi:MAG: PQQ-dependent sugar dehydrogenase, partial [Saprospiraceae bacterium]|nr:PQQ-dependent sugar dehydrogenase [Saprospiraceae bacterium]